MAEDQLVPVEWDENGNPTRYEMQGPRAHAVVPQATPFFSPNAGDAQEQLRRLGLQLLGPRQTAIQESILQQQRLAQGSPQEILAAFNSQINNIQQQLQQATQIVGRQGGFALGGQRNRQRGQVLGGAASQLQNVFTQAQAQGISGVTGAASAIRPVTALQIPPATESITSGGNFNLSGTGQIISDLYAIYKKFFGGNDTAPTPATNPNARYSTPNSPSIYGSAFGTGSNYGSYAYSGGGSAGNSFGSAYQYSTNQTLLD